MSVMIDDLMHDFDGVENWEAMRVLEEKKEAAGMRTFLTSVEAKRSSPRAVESDAVDRQGRPLQVWYMQIEWKREGDRKWESPGWLFAGSMGQADKIRKRWNRLMRDLGLEGRVVFSLATSPGQWVDWLVSHAVQAGSITEARAERLYRAWDENEEMPDG